jgi:WD40 repeat protein
VNLNTFEIILVWSVPLQTGKCDKVVDKLHGGDIFSICYTGEDQLLSSGVDGNILSWDIKVPIPHSHSHSHSLSLSFSFSFFLIFSISFRSQRCY